MERSSNGSKSLSTWFFTVLRFAPIIAFVLFAAGSFAFYAAPTMTFMGEKGENVYELMKLEEPFAENLFILAYITLGLACITTVLFILPQTANRKYYVVWLHEIVAAVSTVLYVSILVQVCKGMDFVKEWGFETGAGLILPLVFIIFFLVLNVASVILWRLFDGETALKTDAQNYTAKTVLPPKPMAVEKPLARMPESIQKCTKLYKKKCFYTIAMWGLICTLLLIVFGLIASNFDRGRHPIYLLHVATSEMARTRLGVSDWFVWAFLYFLMLAIIIILITAIVFQSGKQKKVWNFKRSNVWYVIGQLILLAVSAATLYFSYSICQDMLNDPIIHKNIHRISTIIALEDIDIKITMICAAAVVLLFVLFRMILQVRIGKVKKSGDFVGDVAFYESNFETYGAEYKQYRAELRKYNRKTYRYRRAQTALE